MVEERPGPCSRVASDAPEPGPFQRTAAMKCQKCTKAATLHITEVLSDEQFEELHLCEDCAQKYLYEPQQAAAGKKGGEAGQVEEADETGLLNQRECPVCGKKTASWRVRHRACGVF